ncbi:serine hydrolase domain-containing protein [Aquisediminimonas profunda]|uniref:serine hydrolase domain-containing protein n=1 Tax=Aquisediminimonas profunda TaxID=1550733 RepID=UPI001C625C7D|nr:serine hydrolase domain-containing protein [Aquisediminimonas profunda]
MTAIQGKAAPGFELVRQAFLANFSERSDIGAAVALVIDGELVVDLWGGVADPALGRPWQADTLANVWSTTKGVTAACFAMLAERGQIDYDAPVAKYWSEFGAAGKENVTVGMLLSHQAGLCGFRNPATIEDFYDAERAAARLAAAEPFWEPGTQSGYHAITIGFLATALFRRAEGRTIKQFVKDEFGDLDIHIGLPEERTQSAATMLAPPELSSTGMVGEPTEAQLAAMANPIIDPLLPNTDAWRAAEIPSANGFATARGLAKLYGALAGSGDLDGRQLVSRKTIATATDEQIRGMDAILSIPASWGCGFLRNSDGVYGPNEGAFGHSGWGGSFAFADPTCKLGLAYTMNRMGTDLMGDPRNVALVDSVYASLSS